MREATIADLYRDPGKPMRWAFQRVAAERELREIKASRVIDLGSDQDRRWGILRPAGNCLLPDMVVGRHEAISDAYKSLAVMEADAAARVAWCP